MTSLCIAPIQKDSSTYGDKSSCIAPDGCTCQVGLSVDERVCIECEGIFSSQNYDIHLVNEHMYSLKDIDISNVSTVICFIKAFGIGLTHLNLSEYQISADQMLEILAYCPNLKVLISDMNITDKILIEGISKLSKLEELKLTQCFECTDYGLYNGISKLSELKIISLYGCEKFSDEAFDTAICILSRLEIVELFFWNKLTNESISVTSQKLKGLQSLNVGWMKFIPKHEPLPVCEINSSEGN